MGRVAQLYFLEKETQSTISRRLNLSQATISRLLKRAQDEDIVRITINVPRGTFFDLESKLPLRIEIYDTGDRLMEQYGYEDLQVNVGLSDLDFDPANPDYKF